MDASEIAGCNNSSETAMQATKELIAILNQTLATNKTIEDIHYSWLHSEGCRKQQQ